MLPHGCPPTRAAVQPAVALCRCLLLALSPRTCRVTGWGWDVLLERTGGEPRMRRITKQAGCV